MSGPRLLGLSTSPWTAKAAFALDYAGVSYEFVEHTPMLGERRLRALAGVRHASVPLLLGPDGPVMTSFEIARWADGQSTAQLFPVALEAEILDWHERSERILNVARQLVLQRLLASPAAHREALPGFVPGFLRGALGFGARQGLTFLMKKYGVARAGGAELLATVLRELEELNRAVATAGSRDTLLARFTFADIAMAAAVNAFSPAAAEPLTRPMGPAFRAAWTHPEVTERFPALFSWRDRIYAHRGAS